MQQDWLRKLVVPLDTISNKDMRHSWTNCFTTYPLNLQKKKKRDYWSFALALCETAPIFTRELFQQWSNVNSERHFSTEDGKQDWHLGLVNDSAGQALHLIPPEMLLGNGVQEHLQIIRNQEILRLSLAGRCEITGKMLPCQAGKLMRTKTNLTLWGIKTLAKLMFNRKRNRCLEREKL